MHGATAVAFVAQALTRPSDPREKDELRWALTWLVPRDLEPWQELLLALDDLVRWALGPAHTLVYERPGDDLRGYLGARVASGEVSRERLEVAAYAGSAEARALLESPPEQPADTAEWVLGLGRRGLSWALRALALLGSHEAFEEPRWLADPARTRPYDPDSVAMLPPSAYEQMSRAHACQSLRRWADTGREDLRTSIAAVRRHDGAPVRAGAEAALASRATLLDVLATCAAGTPPSHSLIQRVLEARRDRGRRERIERAVVRWALRVESRAGPWRATFSAPGRP